MTSSGPRTVAAASTTHAAGVPAPWLFLEGSYQHTLGFGTMEFWLFNLAILLASPIYAWLYDVAGQIAFAAVLYHGLGNVFAELFHVEGLGTVELLVEAAVAAVVVIGTWRWMTRRSPA